MTDALRTGDDTFTARLRAYIALVAAEFGVGLESCHLETDELAAAYLALDQRVAAFPDQDVALLWDERSGWSIALETEFGQDEMVEVAVFGDHLLPEPSAVARFVASASAGTKRSVTVLRRSIDRGALKHQLARYA